MKRVIIVAVLVVIIALLVGGWWWARQEPDQVTQFLVDGGLEASRAEQFVTLVSGEREAEEAELLVASGSVEGETVSIVSEFGGQIVEVSAGEGDQVEAGQILVVLDDTILQAQIAQAEAAVQAAEAHLAAVQAGTHPAEILAARAQLQQTIAQRDAAKTGWEGLLAMLDWPQDIEGRLVQARSAADLAAVQVKQAEAELALAIVERDQYRAQGSLEEKRLYIIHNFRVEAAQAALDAAREDRNGARLMVAALEALHDNPLALVTQVHSAESQFHVAASAVEVAAAKLEELGAGALPEEIALAEARVASAEAAAAALQTQVDKTRLVAPVDGVVTSCSGHVGETAMAGVSLLTIAQLDEVTLTIYIPEDELDRVYIGQQVSVQVDSYPDRVFAGTVSYVAQEAEFTPKNVQMKEDRVNMVFAVKVRLPNPQHYLKPGMPADATIRD